MLGLFSCTLRLFKTSLNMLNLPPQIEQRQQILYPILFSLKIILELMSSAVEWWIPIIHSIYLPHSQQVFELLSLD